MRGNAVEHEGFEADTEEDFLEGRGMSPWTGPGSLLSRAPSGWAAGGTCDQGIGGYLLPWMAGLCPGQAGFPFLARMRFDL